MRHEKHVEMMRAAVARLNEVLQKEFPELSPADHSFVADHVSMLLHQSFHHLALVDQQSKKRVIVPAAGPING